MRASLSFEGQPEGRPPHCTRLFTLPGATKSEGNAWGPAGGVHAAPRLRADAPRDSIVALESGFARPGLSEYVSTNRVRGGRGVRPGRSQSAVGSPGRAELKRRGSGGPTLASAADGVGVGSGPRECLKRHP